MPSRAATLLALVLVLFVFPVSGAEPSAPVSPWRPVQSDLPPDPLLIDGVLPNGVRYLLLPNAEPKDQISLRFVVGVGSRQENDDERGLAHFVEHMAFRGTRDYPNGKMTAALQRLGIALGPDSTAFTTFDYTIYHLELPDAREATIRAGLHAFREYADGVTFDQAQIEQERGVVLAEMALRDTPDDRASFFNTRLLWPNSREVKRKVIGDARQIRTFTREQFVAFYDAWYRPERMAVIAVGAIDAAQLRDLIAAEFGSLRARAAARPEPGPNDLAWIKNVGVHRDPGTVGMALCLEKPLPRPPGPDTHSRRVAKLHRDLGMAMLQLRLRQFASTGKVALAVPSAYVSEGLRDWEVACVSAGGRMAEWRQVACELEQEHRRAVAYGFTTAEMEEARAMFITGLEEHVRSAPTRPSPWLCQQLLGTLLNGAVFTTPAERQRDLAPALKAVQAEDCLRALRAVWLQGGASVFVSANSEFTVTDQEVAAAMNASREQPVLPPTEGAIPEFAYRDFGPAGRLVRDEHLADLDVRLAAFANGVRLNFKTTAFDADTVEVRVRVGDGKQSQLLSRPALALQADLGFAAGGLGRHTEQELARILRSHALQVSFHVQPDACVFTARCARRELELTLRVIAAYMTDAAFSPNIQRQVQTQIGTVYGSLAASPGGPFAIAAMREIFSGDPRFSTPTFEETSGTDVGELRAWLEPQLTSGPVELSIVGDVSWEDARQAVSLTLGALPNRPDVTTRTADVPLSLAPVPDGIRTYPISPELKQVAVAWYWPMPVVASVEEERRCHFLAALLAERLRVRLRDELGATYAPSVSFDRILGFSNANFFVFYAEIAPAKMNAVLRLLEQETASLARKGPTADEFERTRLPYLRAMADDLRTNAYWGATVLSDPQQRPLRLSAARNRTADIAAITRAEIAALARRCLSPKLAFKFATLPSAVGPAGPAPATH
ncbi:insulinase family protein [Opitutus sp. ER46]|uniref:M16 family metallopeptidase n=1 Tax=Opitutus sp. ER46 TaxID=2161864 RepID=UPI000D30A51D|nr:insulinase family protein [Opitutus sp. ER46]PTY01084.1 hypothetical protein DB354_00690 [Opitutus sp. ER46]